MKPMLFFEYETLVNLPEKLLIKKEVLQKLLDDAYAAGVEDGKKDALIEKLKEDSKPGSGSPLWNYRDIGSNPWWKVEPTTIDTDLHKIKGSITGISLDSSNLDPLKEPQWSHTHKYVKEYLNEDAERRVQKELRPSVRTPDIKPVEITC